MQAVSDLTWHLPLCERPHITFAGGGTFEPSTATIRLQERWTLHIYFYHALLHTSGHTFSLAPGTMLLIPPGVANTYEWSVRSFHYAAHFKYPGHEIYAGEDEATTPLPAFTILHTRLTRMTEGMAEMVATHADNPLRAEVRLWDILHDLTEAMPETATPAMHPAVRHIRREIEKRLSEPLSIPELARRAGFSHNHANRIFKQETGMTIGAYLVERRMQRAAYLLQHTNEAVKTVARQTGFADVQFFNKTVRRFYGQSPTALRTAQAPTTAGPKRKTQA